MKGKKEKCDDGGEIQGLGQVWKQPARKVWRSSRSFVEECSHKVSSAARPKSERTVSQGPTDERMERAQLVALLLPKRFMICALNLLLIVLPGAGAAVGTYLPGIGVLIRYRPAPKSPGGPNNKVSFWTPVKPTFKDFGRRRKLVLQLLNYRIQAHNHAQVQQWYGASRSSAQIPRLTSSM